MSRKYDVAAYVWPAYTGDEPRTRMFWPEGIGEWQSVKSSVSKYPGHQWPRKPLWGYVNEADPSVMQMQIDVAASHGVNVFIYDWYWYDGRPFLENCLNDGYLKAPDNSKVKFYLMWANHDVNNTWDIRLSHLNDNIIWRGSVGREEFEIIAKRLIERYFKHPSYYRIDGKPVFMVYDTKNLMKGLGGVEGVKAAFKWFREEAVRSGLPGLHLQFAYWGERSLNLSGVDGCGPLAGAETLESLGFESLSNYQFVHFTNIDRDYRLIMEDVLEEWRRIEGKFSIPYFPHVSIGWDNNPRFKEFRPGVVKGNTPEQFRKALEKAKAYVDAHPSQAPLITVNSWNEWTESSYLEPDDLYGYGYLEAVKSVFPA